MPETKKTEEKKDVKITQEEADNVRELQNKYTQITVNMGQLSIAREKMKENLIEEYQTVTIIDEEDENIDTNSSKQDNLDAEKIEDAFSDSR